eukprot:COSAG02_NODE_524_length_20723_cov_79.399438_9_plen_61_part_00
MASHITQTKVTAYVVVCGDLVVCGHAEDEVDAAAQHDSRARAEPIAQRCIHSGTDASLGT